MTNDTVGGLQLWHDVSPREKVAIEDGLNEAGFGVEWREDPGLAHLIYREATDD